MSKANTITLAMLDQNRQAIALEGVGLFSATSAIVRKLSAQIMDGAKFIKDKMSAVTIYEYENQDFEQYPLLASQSAYTIYRDYPVVTPLNLSSTLPDNAECLLDALKQIDRLVEDVINPFDIFIGKIINNPVFAESASYEHNLVIKNIAKCQENLQKQYKSRKSGEQPFKDAYKSMKDVARHHNYLLEMTSLLNNVSLTRVQTRTNELNVNLMTLHDTINSNVNGINLNAKLTTSLSDLIYQVAAAVEAYAVIDSLVTDHIEAAKVNNGRFSNWLR